MLTFIGCVHLPPSRDRADVSRDLQTRVSQTLGPRASVDEIVIPKNLELGQAMNEDQVVMLALWNNPLFQETLVELSLTKADLLQAGLLPNPDAIFFFGMPGKPYKYAAELPIEAIWLRPIRLKIAGNENARSAERLAQVALDLIRDTRQAYADVLLAQERKRIAKRAVELRGGLSESAKKRLDAGDASVQEASTAKIDSMQAEQDAKRINFELPLAEERLRNLLGLGGISFPIILDSALTQSNPGATAEILADEAVRSRPDALAAEVAVAAAAERLRFAKIGWVRFLGIADASSGRRTGHEFGPAFRVTLPIFNHNQGIIARSEAELEQLQRRCVTIRNQIHLDVRLAYLRLEQAEAEAKYLRENVLPEVTAAIARAKKAFIGGGASYIIVLETTRQEIDTLNREAMLHAERRRAWAELERSVGRRLPLPLQALLEPLP